MPQRWGDLRIEAARFCGLAGRVSRWRLASRGTKGSGKRAVPLPATDGAAQKCHVFYGASCTLYTGRAGKSIATDLENRVFRGMISRKRSIEGRSTCEKPRIFHDTPVPRYPVKSMTLRKSMGECLVLYGVS
jgi:hypothetical protein